MFRNVKFFVATLFITLVTLSLQPQSASALVVGNPTGCSGHANLSVGQMLFKRPSGGLSNGSWCYATASCIGGRLTTFGSILRCMPGTPIPPACTPGGNKSLWVNQTATRNAQGKWVYNGQCFDSVNCAEGTPQNSGNSFTCVQQPSCAPGGTINLSNGQSATQSGQNEFTVNGQCYTNVTCNGGAFVNIGTQLSCTIFSTCSPGGNKSLWFNQTATRNAQGKWVYNGQCFDSVNCAEGSPQNRGSFFTCVQTSYQCNPGGHKALWFNQVAIHIGGNKYVVNGQCYNSVACSEGTPRYIGNTLRCVRNTYYHWW